jgi:signal peptidase II
LAVPRNRYVAFLSIAVIGCAVDLLTKHWVFQWRGLPLSNNEWWIWEGYIGIETALNRGALFGAGQGYSTLFAALSIVAAVGILVWLFWFGAAHDLLLTIALACVMGGIGGNLYDRLGLWHDSSVSEDCRNAVRDWILFRYEQYTWPNFNIADCLLVCGAALLVWHGFFQKDPHAKPAEQTGGNAKS